MKVRVNTHSFPFIQFQDNELALQYHPKITNQIFCTITMNSWMETSLMCFNPLQVLPILMSPKALPCLLPPSLSHPSQSLSSATSVKHFPSSQTNLIFLSFGHYSTLKHRGGTFHILPYITAISLLSNLYPCRL